MTEGRWQQVEALFHAALAREPNERSAFLDRECAGDPSLRLEVESLLTSHNESEYGLDAADLAADLLGKGEFQSTIGRSFGPYTISRLLATGGMGTVFVAQDSRLGREVALKLLPSDLARDRDRLRRFEQEARAASALNHPNIVTVYDAGEANGIPFIAMELVDGTTLRHRLTRGRLKLSEALEITAQVASALGAAHRAGIIHRDIKPENILLRPDGYVKVVDFGLSKLTAQPGSDSHTAATAEPAVLTATGLIMGTPHYMSPEQVSAATPDCRTDIFSLGVVLYEMLCGSRAFKGQTAVEVMSSILNEDPPDLPPAVPAQLQGIVRRCLEKEPARRFQSAEDLAFMLRVVAGDCVAGRQLSGSGALGRSRRWILWIPAVTVLLLVLVGALLWRPTETSWKNPLENAQFSKLTDFKGAEINGAISADGKFVVFLSDREGPFDVWVTQLGSGQFNNLTRGRFTGLVNDNVQSVGFSHDAATVWVRAHDGKGSTNIWLFPTLGGGNPRLFLPGGAHAAWMPDGSRLLYAEAGGGDPLFVADRDGSNPKRVFMNRLGYHVHFPTWSSDGASIYFVGGVHMTRQMDLWRIPATGGHPERITDVRNWIISPTVLDDRTLLYTAPAEDGSGPWLYAVDVTQGEPHRISLGVEQYSSISATSSGKRLVATVASWTANLRRLPITDLPAQESETEHVLLPNVRAHSPRYGPDYFLYLSSHGGPEGLWKFKKGEASELWKGSQNGQISAPAISSDGRLIAFTLRKQGRGALYIMTADGTGVRSLESLDVNGVPSWSPDAKWIAVIGDKGEGPRLFKIPVEAGTPVQLTDELAWNPVWSPDGSLIVYVGAAIRSRAHLSAVSPDRKPMQFPRELWVLPMDERYRFTPDGRGLVIMRGDWRMHQFYLLDLATFSERPLSNLKAGALMRSFDISPDGKQILFDRVGEESDIVLIDLKR